MRAVTRNTDPGSHRAVTMGCFAFVGVAFASGAIGLGRNHSFEIKGTTFQTMAFLAVENGLVLVGVKPFESFWGRGLFIWLAGV